MWKNDDDDDDDDGDEAEHYNGFCRVYERKLKRRLWTISICFDILRWRSLGAKIGCSDLVCSSLCIGWIPAFDLLYFVLGTATPLSTVCDMLGQKVPPRDQLSYSVSGS